MLLDILTTVGVSGAWFAQEYICKRRYRAICSARLRQGILGLPVGEAAIVAFAIMSTVLEAAALSYPYWSRQFV